MKDYEIYLFAYMHASQCDYYKELIFLQKKLQELYDYYKKYHQKFEFEDFKRKAKSYGVLLKEREV